MSSSATPGGSIPACSGATPVIRWQRPQPFTSMSSRPRAALGAGQHRRRVVGLGLVEGREVRREVRRLLLGEGQPRHRRLQAGAQVVRMQQELAIQAPPEAPAGGRERGHVAQLRDPRPASARAARGWRSRSRVDVRGGSRRTACPSGLGHVATRGSACTRSGRRARGRGWRPLRAAAPTRRRRRPTPGDRAWPQRDRRPASASDERARAAHGISVPQRHAAVGRLAHDGRRPRHRLAALERRAGRPGVAAGGAHASQRGVRVRAPHEVALGEVLQESPRASACRGRLRRAPRPGPPAPRGRRSAGARSAQRPRGPRQVRGRRGAGSPRTRDPRRGSRRHGRPRATGCAARASRGARRRLRPARILRERQHHLPSRRRGSPPPAAARRSTRGPPPGWRPRRPWASAAPA